MGGNQEMEDNVCVEKYWKLRGKYQFDFEYREEG